MKRLSSLRFFVTAITLLSVAFSLVSTGTAEEPAREFLDALRRRGYPDIAVLYLERMKDSPLLPSDFRNTYDYELGVTKVYAARIERDRDTREKLFDDAQAQLNNFVAKQARHELAPQAIRHLGNVLVERARARIAESGKAQGDKKKALIEQASGFYNEAHTQFQGLREDMKNELLKMPKNIPPEQKDLIARRDKLRQEYLELMLYSASILREWGEMFPKGSTSRKDKLTEAATAFGEIYEKHRRRLAGLYARLWQAKCLQGVGDFTQATDMFGEMLEQPFDNDAFRMLRTKTLMMTANCVAEMPENKETKQRREAGLGFIAEWDKQSRPNEAKNPDWLDLRFEAAKLAIKDMENREDKDPKRKVAEDLAKKWLRMVVRQPGNNKKAAQALLAEIDDIPEKRPEPETFTEAKDAGKAALGMLQGSTALSRKLQKQLAKETDDEKKEEIQKQITTTEETIVTKKADALKYFRMALSLADENVDPQDINVARYYLCYLYWFDQKYYEAAVMGEFIAKRYPFALGAYDCGKIALASYRKEYDVAKEAEADAEVPGEFEIRKIIDVGEFMVKQWPQRGETSQTNLSIVAYSIRLGDYEQAEKFLGSFQSDSPKLGRAELMVGQSMWSKYLMEMKKVRDLEAELKEKKEEAEAQAAAPPAEAPTPVDVTTQPVGERPGATTPTGTPPAATPDPTPETPPATSQDPTAPADVTPPTDTTPPTDSPDTPEESTGPEDETPAAGDVNPELLAQIEKLEADVEQVRTKAKALQEPAERLLRQGIERSRGGEVDSRLALAVLSICQLLVEVDKPQGAIDYLEDQQVGILKLVADGHEATKKPGFADETYKIALRAYVGVLPEQTDNAKANEMVLKAQDAMEGLKETVTAKEGGEALLMSTYISLAKQIERKIEGSDPEVKRALSKGFETFLTRIGEQTDDQNILFWVAETLFALGSSFDTGTSQLTPESKEYYDKAITAFVKLMEQVESALTSATEKDEKKKLEGLLSQIHLRLAHAHSRLGDYEKSIEMYHAILSKQEMMLNVQIEAAGTFDKWGAKDPEQYRKALVGAFKASSGDKNIIWGWIRMAKITARYPEHRNTFYRGRYQIANTLYRQGKSKKDTDIIEKGKSVLANTAALYPKLGGEKQADAKRPEDQQEFKGVKIEDWKPRYDELMRKIQSELDEKVTGIDPFCAEEVEEEPAAESESDSATD